MSHVINYSSNSVGVYVTGSRVTFSQRDGPTKYTLLRHNYIDFKKTQYILDYISISAISLSPLYDSKDTFVVVTPKSPFITDQNHFVLG